MRANDIVRWLRRQGNRRASTGEVAIAFGVRAPTAEAWLSMLASEGKVERSSIGEWKATYKGAEREREFRYLRS